MPRIIDNIVQISACDGVLYGLSESGVLYQLVSNPVLSEKAHWMPVTGSPGTESP